ncbi:MULTISPECIES: cysteine hydrolase family protein [Mammaliicoccus]|uniref:Cysteine hydrolase n=1 Tax=Mammaliicoccus fleurettii TaxID=150056 RepID=A0ABS5MMY8_9STAP|nr:MULTISPECIES: isochorismatase family cysteine hydrolase [Mammaliicoccus]HCN60099.1 cysteine hydrolase [Staphylococcus sp.]MBL0847603.1 cysteine hydrolase [Mammaliicoccus fleurettii]MBO3062046.1 cysteine hydrolase [Mammaliicoccus fleurettii]MBS3673102.1 cysteine hydrolase [Mammaliicoccus fleurettii]MBS3697293.1 cysteine hydrolase [Mammaliicoccus fleurettii]
MKKALIVVDYSNDFVATDGKLTCGEPGQKIEKNIYNKIEDYNTNQDLIFYLMDYHFENDPYHPETKLFPPHNIKGTNGRELYNTLKSQYEEIQNSKNVFWLDKTRYSAFFGTNLDSLLRERAVDTVEIVGVCTDICVLHTAIDAYNLNYKIHIPKNCVASFNQAGHDWALTHFENSIGAFVE